MLKKMLVIGLNIGLLALMVAACTPPPEEPEVDSSSSATTMSGRSAYGEISLPPESQRFGTNPEQIVLDAFGMGEPTEGNFNQEVSIVEQSTEKAIVTLTQTGLLDDSVEGMRYWIELTAGENDWEMTWAGRQVRCYSGRGAQDWTTELCS